jgi:hypothetical protein
VAGHPHPLSVPCAALPGVERGPAPRAGRGISGGAGEYTATLTPVVRRNHNGWYMNLDFQAVCDYASLTVDGKVNIMGIFQEINPPGYPCSVASLFVVVSFKAFPGEYESEKSIKLVLVDPDGRELMTAMGDPIKVPRPAKPGGESRINQIFGLQGVPFARYGPHSFEIMVENDTKGHIALLLNQAPSSRGDS